MYNNTIANRSINFIYKIFFYNYAPSSSSNIPSKAIVTARIGGDEFAVLLPGTPENTAVQKCRLLSENLKSYKNADKTAKLHFSCGSATSEAPGEPLRNVMKRADLKKRRPNGSATSMMLWYNQ